MRAVTMKPAHRSQSVFRVEFPVKDSYTTAADFASRLKPGKKNPTARPWGVSRKFEGAFVIKFLKGDRPQIVTRKGAKSGRALKVLMGPALPKELLRANKPAAQNVAESVPERLIPELVSQLGFAQSQAAKAGKVS